MHIVPELQMTFIFCKIKQMFLFYIQTGEYIQIHE